MHTLLWIAIALFVLWLILKFTGAVVGFLLWVVLIIAAVFFVIWLFRLVV